MITQFPPTGSPRILGFLWQTFIRAYCILEGGLLLAADQTPLAEYDQLSPTKSSIAHSDLDF